MAIALLASLYATKQHEPIHVTLKRCATKIKMQCDLSCDLRCLWCQDEETEGKSEDYDCSECIQFAILGHLGIDMTNYLHMGLPKLSEGHACYQSVESAVEAIEANLVSICMIKVYDWSKHAIL